MELTLRLVRCVLMPGFCDQWGPTQRPLRTACLKRHGVHAVLHLRLLLAYPLPPLVL